MRTIRSRVFCSNCNTEYEAAYNDNGDLCIYDPLQEKYNDGCPHCGHYCFESPTGELIPVRRITENELQELIELAREFDYG